MNISVNPCILLNNDSYCSKSNKIRFNSQLEKDTVSFGETYKKQYNGIDCVVINKFKPNIRKFSTTDELQKWCKEKFDNEYLHKDYTGRRYYSKLKRENIMKEWFEHLNGNNKYTNAEKLLIIDGITKNLNNRNDELPPVLNIEILEDTLNEIKNNANKNKNYNVKFDKLYQTKLREPYLAELENGTGWIVIPGIKNDNEHIKENINKLKILSHPNWCTRADAEQYLSNGDFHIYFENGKTKIGINYHGDVIGEIKDENNDSEIQPDYKKIVFEHIHNNDFSFSAIINDLKNFSKESIATIRTLFENFRKNYF